MVDFNHPKHQRIVIKQHLNPVMNKVHPIINKVDNFDRQAELHPFFPGIKVLTQFLQFKELNW